MEGRKSRVFIGSYDQGLYDLDPGNGSLKWRYAARGGIYSSPALVASGGEEMVLVLGWDNMLHAVALENGASLFSAFTGRPLWNVAGMDDSNWSSPSAARIDGSWMAFVGSYDGTLRSLPLGESERAAPVLKSNRWFYLSFPMVLIPFFFFALGITVRERRRRREPIR